MKRLATLPENSVFADPSICFQHSERKHQNRTDELEYEPDRQSYDPEREKDEPHDREDE
jgi:hypothetical protein